MVLDILSDCDAIINFAAESHVDRSIETPEVFVQTNVLGTVNLLNCAKTKGIKRFLQISTDEVYGSIEKGYFTEKPHLLRQTARTHLPKQALIYLFRLILKHTAWIQQLLHAAQNNFGPCQYPEKLIPFFISNLF